MPDRILKSAAVCLFLCFPAPLRAAPAPLAPLPGTASSAQVDPPAPPSVAERLSRGVVTIEKDSRVIAIGAVLSGDGDGRILTALSPLGSATTAEVRYADGSVARARVGHSDKAWDLALLVPVSGRWVDGLAASESSPLESSLQAPVAMHAGRPGVVAAHVRGMLDARAREGTSVLSSVLDVELQGATPTVGAPLTDSTGGVVGVFVKVCQATLPTVSSAAGGAASASPPPPPPCSPLVVAAPIAAIRDFLLHTPATAVAPAPWLGINGVPDTERHTKGVRVMAVAPDSPAQKAGLKSSDDRSQADLIVAVDGQPVDSPEQLADLIGRHAIGDKVKLLLLSGEKFREVQVALKAAP